MERDRSPKNIEASKGSAFFVWCDDCKKTIYEAEYNNMTTRLVAYMQIQGHVNAFTKPHNVRLIEIDKDQGLRNVM